MASAVDQALLLRKRMNSPSAAVPGTSAEAKTVRTDLSVVVVVVVSVSEAFLAGTGVGPAEEWVVASVASVGCTHAAGAKRA